MYYNYNTLYLDYLDSSDSTNRYYGDHNKAL